MNSEKKITVREGGWDDFWILRDGIGEEQHIHAMNRPDILRIWKKALSGRKISA